MYFKKLELIGFKSFFDKTTLHFEPGITAVVGPNGCGKSNIFDSIRWVLGEQSAKSLRGSEMQDVIFNGTDFKEPLSLAEVSLTFDNEARFFNVEYPEVTITRRIFRSGESEYLLNKTQVRLRDILDLLLGTGIGAESYSIVAQGKIDLVLSSRPEDRRLVFDEASGITKYKSQKREATRRLEETEQNLLRVNDIITEVKRQIGSLERQANKARRYKEVFEELKQKEINSSVLEKNELLKQNREIQNQFKGLESTQDELANIIREQESKISNRQNELRLHEQNLMAIKNQLLNLENQITRNKGRITFNQEKVIELTANLMLSETQLAQQKNKLILDEEKLSGLKEEFAGIKDNIETKSGILAENQARISSLSTLIKNSLENITQSKRLILELASKISNTRNEISDFSAKQQIYLARQKRLEIEKAKVYEEKAIAEMNLDSINREVEGLKKIAGTHLEKIDALKKDTERECITLNNINSELGTLEKKRLTLESHRDFLLKLKTEYEDISESMNAVVYLDRIPGESISGLVVKLKQQEKLEDGLKFSGEAKPVEFDTQKIDEKIKALEQGINALKEKREVKEVCIEELRNRISGLGKELHEQEIVLANKETSRSTILEQFNKIKEEEDLIVLELTEVTREISVLAKNIEVTGGLLAEVNKEHQKAEDLILQEEDNITKNSRLKEEALVVVTRTKAELDAFTKRMSSEEVTLKIWEDTYKQDADSLANIEKQINDNKTKKETLSEEIRVAESEILEFSKELESQTNLLKVAEVEYRNFSEGAGDVAVKIEADRKELDSVKNRLYELQMQGKDIDYKYASLKERIFSAYKIDLEGIEDTLPELNPAELTQEIERLKEKLDSYGTVNLVAIEEYDELKKRYDFLIQQQTDLVTAKDSLHEAILKINRTTKKMFLETFEKVRLEFRNYFRLMFNGGDAQVFLIDEQDPLESGIEIICRPPGKKLQNVLLLSGGEKSMAAIALIFAIFKVKPSPFCILDEIDAALDEANVGRFSRILQEFARTSQFIVITHNKKTIVNANVMYGITMEQSGISKIVSVKFAKESTQKDKEPDLAVPDPV